MNEKWRIIKLRENPIPARKKKRAGRRKRTPARRRISSRRRHIHASSRARGGYIVEAMKESGHGRVRFLYWTGRSFVASRGGAKIFKTESEANKAARHSMKRRPAAFRLARVLRA